jgi:hypothetical protein
MSALLGVGLTVIVACSSSGDGTAEVAGTGSTGASVLASEPSLATTRAPAERTVSGTLVMGGGRYPGYVIRVPGQVRAELVNGDAPPVIAIADTTGRFILHLPDGRYQLSGTSPHYNAGAVTCTGNEVVVTGNAAGLLVACPMR